MKKVYKTPCLKVTEFRFSEHIADSTSSCYWGSSATWTHAFEGCSEVYHPGTGGWIDLNG